MDESPIEPLQRAITLRQEADYILQGVVAGQVHILANSDGFEGLQAIQDRLPLAFFVVAIGAWLATWDAVSGR
jgi:hypothetical protein